MVVRCLGTVGRYLISSFVSQNRAKVAMVPSLGPPWGAESAARMINDVERVLLADGKQPDRDYLCGTEFSQADVCATCLFDMLTVQGHSQLIASRPSITCYLSRMRDRDGYKKGVEEWKLRLRK